MARASAVMGDIPLYLNGRMSQAPLLLPATRIGGLRTAGAIREFGLQAFSVPSEQWSEFSLCWMSSRTGAWLDDGFDVSRMIFDTDTTLIIRKRMRQLRITLDDGVQRLVQVDEFQLIGELVPRIASQLQVRDSVALSLARAGSRLELPRRDRLIAWGIGEEETLLFRSLFLAADAYAFDDPAVALPLFERCKANVVSGAFVATYEDDIKLAALLIQDSIGDYDPSVVSDAQLAVMASSLMQPLFRTRPSLRTDLAARLSLLVRRYSLANAAKIEFVARTRALKSYGSATWRVKERRSDGRKTPGLLCVSSERILRVDVDTQEVASRFKYDQLLSFTLNSEDTLTLDFGKFAKRPYVAHAAEAPEIMRTIQEAVDYQARKRGEVPGVMPQVSLVGMDGRSAAVSGAVAAPTPLPAPQPAPAAAPQPKQPVLLSQEWPPMVPKASLVSLLALPPLPGGLVAYTERVTLAVVTGVARTLALTERGQVAREHILKPLALAASLPALYDDVIPHCGEPSFAAAVLGIRAAIGTIATALQPAAAGVIARPLLEIHQSCSAAAAAMVEPLQALCGAAAVPMLDSARRAALAAAINSLSDAVTEQLKASKGAVPAVREDPARLKALTGCIRTLAMGTYSLKACLGGTVPLLHREEGRRHADSLLATVRKAVDELRTAAMDGPSAEVQAMQDAVAGKVTHAIATLQALYAPQPAASNAEAAAPGLRSLDQSAVLQRVIRGDPTLGADPGSSALADAALALRTVQQFLSRLSVGIKKSTLSAAAARDLHGHLYDAVEAAAPLLGSAARAPAASASGLAGPEGSFAEFARAIADGSVRVLPFCVESEAARDSAAVTAALRAASVALAVCLQKLNEGNAPDPATSPPAFTVTPAAGAGEGSAAPSAASASTAPPSVPNAMATAMASVSGKSQHASFLQQRAVLADLHENMLASLARRPGEGEGMGPATAGPAPLALVGADELFLAVADIAACSLIHEHQAALLDAAQGLAFALQDMTVPDFGLPAAPVAAASTTPAAASDVAAAPAAAEPQETVPVEPAAEPSAWPVAAESTEPAPALAAEPASEPVSAPVPAAEPTAETAQPAPEPAVAVTEPAPPAASGRDSSSSSDGSTSDSNGSTSDSDASEPTVSVPAPPALLDADLARQPAATAAVPPAADPAVQPAAASAVDPVALPDAAVAAEPAAAASEPAALPSKGAGAGAQNYDTFDEAPTEEAGSVESDTDSAERCVQTCDFTDTDLMQDDAAAEAASAWGPAVPAGAAPAASPHTEPAAATSHTEPAAASPHTEPAATTPHTEPAAASPHTEPAAATSHTEPAAASPRTEPALQPPAPQPAVRREDEPVSDAAFHHTIRIAGRSGATVACASTQGLEFLGGGVVNFQSLGAIGVEDNEDSMRGAVALIVASADASLRLSALRTQGALEGFLDAQREMIASLGTAVAGAFAVCVRRSDDGAELGEAVKEFVDGVIRFEEQLGRMPDEPAVGALLVVTLGQLRDGAERIGDLLNE